MLPAAFQVKRKRDPGHSSWNDNKDVNDINASQVGPACSSALAMQVDDMYSVKQTAHTHAIQVPGACTGQEHPHKADQVRAPPLQRSAAACSYIPASVVAAGCGQALCLV